MASPDHAARVTRLGRWKPLGYLLAYLVPALMPVSAWLATRTGLHDAAAWFPLLFLFVLLPLADHRSVAMPPTRRRRRGRGAWRRATATGS